MSNTWKVPTAASIRNSVGRAMVELVGPIALELFGPIVLELDLASLELDSGSGDGSGCALSVILK